MQFTHYPASIARALDPINATGALPQDGLIIIKPNLANSSPPAVTTSVEVAEASRGLSPFSRPMIVMASDNS